MVKLKNMKSLSDNIPPAIEKELDLIDNTISRLDIQIQTSKNICITLWVAWMGWFISQQIQKDNSENFGLAILASALFPVIFWLVDYQFRKALLLCSRRQNIISLHLNDMVGNNSDNPERFPVLDPLGSLYQYKIGNNKIKASYNTSGTNENEESEQLPKKSVLQILFYKEAGWFYSLLFLISIATGWIIYCKC